MGSLRSCLSLKSESSDGQPRQTKSHPNFWFSFDRMEFLIGTHSQSSEYSELVNSLFGLFFSFLSFLRTTIWPTKIFPSVFRYIELDFRILIELNSFFRLMHMRRMVQLHFRSCEKEYFKKENGRATVSSCFGYLLECGNSVTCGMTEREWTKLNRILKKKGEGVGDLTMRKEGRDKISGVWLPRLEVLDLFHDFSHPLTCAGVPIVSRDSSSLLHPRSHDVITFDPTGKKGGRGRKSSSSSSNPAPPPAPFRHRDCWMKNSIYFAHWVRNLCRKAIPLCASPLSLSHHRHFLHITWNRILA